MGEIKSTLDLVMEKTKHMTLSEAEKKEHRNDEDRKKIRGMLQKYLDGGMAMDELAAGIEKLRNADNPAIDRLLKREIFEKVDLDRENRPLFGLLNKLYGIDTRPLEALLKRYREDLDSESRRRAAASIETLKKQRFISGAAVVPNLENDAEWETRRKGIHGQYGEALEKEKRRIS